MLFIDFSSAFNTVIPQQLINKLNLLGLNTSLCNWILDLLTARPQSVRVGRNTSSTTTLSTGGPRGCVLSPLLFTLLTHDCTAKFSSNHIIKFADDTTVVGLISNNEEMYYREEVAQLVEWCGTNNLSLNVGKTKEVVMDFRRNSVDHPPLTIDSSTVERVSSTKFLGVHITEDLTWTTNTMSLSKKAQQRLHFLRRLKRASLPPPILITFYRGAIESVLTSCITVWYGNCSAADRKTLQRTVNTAAKIIGAPLPSILNIFLTRCSSKANSIVKDSTHPSHSLFQLQSSGRRFRSIRARSARLLNSFFPQAVRALNSNHPAPLWNPIQVQVELYCHSATCGEDIQWNEMSCLTGPWCYIHTDIKQTYKPPIVGIDNVGAQGHEMGISDHKLIVFGFPLPLVKPKTKTTISYRNLKSVTIDSFSVAIPASPLSSALNLLSPDEILSTYNETICNVLDDLALLKTRTVPSAHSSPWFTPELRVMKAECRRYERLHKKSSLVVHAIAFSDSVVKYKDTLNTARSTYLSTVINKAKCKPKALFSEINKLVKPSSAAINGSVALCESFQSFFLSKIDNIYQDFSPSVSPHLSPCLIGHPLNTFLPTNISAVEQLVIKSNSASCTLDPIPTYLLKTLLPSLIQPITHIINRSLATGYVPQDLKVAAITPILKKPGLDNTDLNNFRPISNLPFVAKILEKVVAAQLQSHLEKHNLYEQFPSGFVPLTVQKQHF